tara:strand:+ start:127 stop:483 length:357 start_codon:yes stop_codon:yes gene_type:complete
MSVNKNNLDNDDTRDLSILIIEYLIKDLKWDMTDQKEEDWYPFNLQDGINDIINGFMTKDNEVCNTCDQYPYSDIDSMCPVCGKLIIDHNKTSAVSCDIICPEKCTTCGKEIINHSYC